MKYCISITLMLSVAFLSCSKKDADDSLVPPPAVIHTDTLSSGWAKIQVTSAGDGLVDIVFQNNTTGYAAGANMYKTTDGGITWNKLTGYSGPGTENLTVTADGKLFVAGEGNKITRSADGGGSFTSVNTGLGGGGMLQDVFFYDNNTGFAVGSGGLVTTANGGVNWTVVNPVTGLSLAAYVYSTGWFFSSSSGIIATGLEIYKSNGSLNTWTKSIFTGSTPGSVISLFAVSPSLVYAASADGKVFQSVDGGVSFSLKAVVATTPGSYYFTDVHFTDANTGYVSTGNRIYKTLDGGSSWQVVVALGTSVISEIHFTDATHGWGCTNKGEVVKFN